MRKNAGRSCAASSARASRADGFAARRPVTRAARRSPPALAAAPRRGRLRARGPSSRPGPLLGPRARGRGRRASSCPAFERAPPGRTRRGPADPLDRGAREAPDGVRRRVAAGRRADRQHLAARVPRARTPSRTSGRASRASSVVAEKDYFPGIWDTNVVDGVLCGVPWYVDTRVLFYRKDLLARGGRRRAAAEWASWRDAMRPPEGAGGRRVGAAILLPTDEWAQPVILGLAGRRRAADADGGRDARLPRAGVPEGGGVLRRPLPRRPRAAAREHADREPLPAVRRGRLRDVRHRPVEPRGVPAAPARVARRTRWATAPLPAAGRDAVTRASRSRAARASSSSARRRGATTRGS